MTSPVLLRPQERKPYQPMGAALKMWRSSRREVLMAGPGDTGKSRACLEKLHFCADKYPKARLLIVRKTRKSLTQSAMVTYEQRVLPEGWLGEKIKFSTTEQQYEYPNGSVIAVGGMDDPAKILSSEWDMIYVQEATELSENDWEILTMRLRNGRMPYQQLIADCNPSYPTHWLKRRADRGATLMLESRHEDNPSLTPERMAVLDALTGVRYLRLRLGKWAAAEGLVYEEWNRAIHLVSREQLSAWAIFTRDGKLNRKVIRQVFAGVDWGFTNPGVIQVYATDSDDRMYLIREVYRTQRTDEWWLEQAQQLQEEFDIEQFVCDPAQPAYIEKFRQHGLSAIGATNDIAPGISAVQSRLKLAGDGRARLYVYEEALQDRDELRDAVSQPCCLEQEIEEYVWPKAKDGQTVKEVPVKVNDHSMDCLRYSCMWMEESSGEIALVSAASRPHEALPPMHETDDDEEGRRIQERQTQLARVLRQIQGGNYYGH